MYALYDAFEDHQGKMIIETVFVCKLIEYEAVIQFYLDIFGTEASTMTMHLGRILLIRVQTSSDIIVVTLMPFYWMMEKYKKSIRSVLFVLSGIYTLIVFSRVLLVEFCCFALVAVLYYWNKIPKKVRYAGVALLGYFISILAETCSENDRIPFLFFICRRIG